MVIVIIGILAAIIVSKFSSQVSNDRIAATKSNLEQIRTAIEEYFAQTNSYPSNNLSELTGDANSKVYLRKIPKEAITPSTTVKTSNDGTGGWHYNTTTNEVLPNLSGNDAEGNPYSGY